MELIIASIDDARDPAHRLGTAPGQKKPPLGRRPERVPAGIQQPANLLLKGRNPSGVFGIEIPRETDEVLQPEPPSTTTISMPAMSVPFETGFSIKLSSHDHGRSNVLGYSISATYFNPNLGDALEVTPCFGGRRRCIPFNAKVGGNRWI